MNHKEMPKAEAERIGALHFFKERYPDPVKVYYVGNDVQSAWSKEFCGGPHVAHTGKSAISPSSKKKPSPPAFGGFAARYVDFIRF